MSPLLATSIVATLALYSVAMALATIRLVRGPAAQDRVLALDVLYINGMLVMLVLGIRFASSMYFVVALLIALFGFVGSAALAKFLLRGEIVE